jgi:formate transporter FocA
VSEAKKINPVPPTFSVDPLLPPAMARKAEEIGMAKAGQPFLMMLALAVLAGAFISLGAIFSTTVTTGAAAMPYGVGRLLGGFVFSLGLILVVVGGAELFTGNTLIVMAWAHRKVSMAKLLKNWVVVYLGNLFGALATALIMFLTGQYAFAGGQVGINALNTAQAKCSLGFTQAIALGVMCNALVCLAVWLCYSARSVQDKIMSIIFPITAFVACGFEHCVANMYFIPIGLLVKDFAGPQFWAAAGRAAADYPVLTWPAFFWDNLLPVTIGNIIGGTVLVGLAYWSIYLRRRGGVPPRP